MLSTKVQMLLKPLLSSRSVVIQSNVLSLSRCCIYLCKKCFTSYSVSTLNTNKVTPIFLAAEKYLERTAIVEQHGLYKYEDILHYSANLANNIRKTCGISETDYLFKNNDRVVFLCENDVSYVVSQWAIWMLGGIAVPLCNTHPASELEYFVEDSQASVAIATENYDKILKPIANKFQVPFLTLRKNGYTGAYEKKDNKWYRWEVEPKIVNGYPVRVKGLLDKFHFNNQYKQKPAMIVYTSGTTGRPKGVVLTHGNLSSQMTGMIKAWGWTNQDIILHVLPLHHVHGIVNILMTSLFCGATCVMMTKFNPSKVWSRLIEPVEELNGLRINVFMAVPTIYAKMIENYEREVIPNGRTELYIKTVCQTKIRLMVSGSAALPESIMTRWEEITGHKLLERYGMSEIGMALTNPLNGPRVPGSVGQPMPWVEVCITKPNSYQLHGYDVIAIGDSKRTKGNPGEWGELYIKGPNVFTDYWRKPEATKQAFTADGWFKTGDTVIYEDNVYKILGRTSVDIIKSGGFKIGALDIERHLLTHPDITDCAVVGLPDMTWGQKVAAILVLTDGKTITKQELKTWASDKMASYQIPSIVKCLKSLPRNTMGKVNKKQLVAEIFPEYSQQPFAA